MNQTVCVSSFAPFFSLSPSPSKSPFASRQSLCLVSNVFPQSKYQSDRITNKPNPPPTSSNFFSKRQPQWKERRGCGKADAISGQDGEAGEEGICVPNVIFYNKHIRGLCKRGEIKKALYVLNIMISKGPAPCVVTYSIIISALCKKGEIDKALALLYIMISKGHEPSIVIYNSLIYRLYQKGEIEKALNLLDVTISKGYEPNVMIYNILIDGLYRKGEIKKASYVLDVMISKGHKPNAKIYNILINELSQKGEIKKT